MTRTEAQPLFRPDRLFGKGNAPLPDGDGSDEQAARRRQIGGVILAGVHQWGGCALDAVLPRPLVPVANYPLISYPLGWLRDAGVSDVCICGNSQTKEVRRSLSSHGQKGLSVEYYEDLMPRGPAGCAHDVWSVNQKATQIVLDGTIIPQVDVRRLLEEHERSGAVLTVVVAPAGVRGDGRDNTMTPVGVYVFSQVALEAIADSGYQDIKEGLIPQLYAQGERVVAFETPFTSPRVVGTESYLAANEWALKQIAGAGGRSGEYRPVGEGWVHESTTVDSTARLIGPVLVGPGGHVEGGATVVGPTSLGARCRVGRRAVVSRSAIWEGCTIGDEAVVDRCVLPHGSVLESQSEFRNSVFTNHQSPLAWLWK